MAGTGAPPKLEKKPVKFSNLLRKSIPKPGFGDVRANLPRYSWRWLEHVRVRIDPQL